MQISYEIPCTPASLPFSFEISPQVAQAAAKLPQDRLPTEREILGLPLSDQRAAAHQYFAATHDDKARENLNELLTASRDPEAMATMRPQDAGLVRAAAEMLEVVAVEHHRQPYYRVDGKNGNQWGGFTARNLPRLQFARD